MSDTVPPFSPLSDGIMSLLASCAPRWVQWRLSERQSYRQDADNWICEALRLQVWVPAQNSDVRWAYASVRVDGGSVSAASPSELAFRALALAERGECLLSPLRLDERSINRFVPTTGQLRLARNSRGGYFAR